MNKASVLLCALLTGVLGACSSGPGVNQGEPGSTYRSSTAYNSGEGRVASIDYIASRERTSGGGAILGGIVGGVLGHQIGSGRGNDAATVAGAIGGALIGNEAEKRNNQSAGGYYSVTVRTNYGNTEVFNYENVGDLRVGDRVRIEGGRITRF